MQALAQHNDDHHYLLTVIDVFSKKAVARCLKRKTVAEVVRAFESIFKESPIPLKLQTDIGKEFLNKSFQTLMTKYDIMHFTTASDLKASVVERFNRTLKRRMWKYFTVNNTMRYRNVLQDLLKGYNNSFHTSIKMTPTEVNGENMPRVLQNLYGAKQTRRCRYKFKVGDSVRISKIRYEQTFTDELFTIDERVPRFPPMYKLKDFDGELIQGSFYEEELQKVEVLPHKLDRVDKILKKRTPSVI